MATNKNTAEAGWFYHAPYKSKPNQEPVGAPPASQIPGLSDLSQAPPEEQQKKLWIKESDSDYIVLAKQGGRPDLLRYRTPKPQSEEPQGYPRCDWYYHNTGAGDDNTTNTEAHEFLLPDYMVHQEWTGGKQGQDRGKDAPFAYDKDTVFVREEGGKPSDKTVRLPEIKPTGYGIRAGKLQGKKQKHAPIERAQPIKPSSEMDDDKLRYEPVHAPKEEYKPVMGKLLSHGYVSEWEQDRDKWNVKQRKNQEKFDAKSRRPQEKMQSEYQQSMVRGGSPSKPTSSGSRQRPPNSRSQPMCTEEERELFKLSKFKNVSSKTESHRVPGPNVISHNQGPGDPYQYSFGHVAT